MTIYDRASVADWIRRLRQKANMSQAQYAAMLGVSQPTLSRWERGVGRIPILYIHTEPGGDLVPELLAQPDDLPFGLRLLE